MNRIFLSLLTNSFNKNQSIRLSQRQPYECNFNTFYRSSPLYEVDSRFSFEQIEDSFSGTIILLYTLQPLEVIDYLRGIEIKDELSFKLYLSKGNASLVLFTTSEDIVNYLDGTKFLIGYETWSVAGNDIISCKFNLPEFEPKLYFNLDLSSIGHEESSIFSDIISSLNYAFFYSANYLKNYIPVIDEVKRKVVDFYNQSLLLNKFIDIDQFRLRILENNSSNPLMADELVDFFNQILNDPFSIDQVYIKDELIQIASVLKISNSQLFGNIPVLYSSTYQSGDNSLLGIGHSLFGFLSIYLHIKDCFSKYNFEEAFEKEFSNPGPKFLLKPDDESYSHWYTIFKNTKDLNFYIKEKEYFTSHLMVYFSNRQGFRLTKHSVSAAMQCLNLSFLPSFTLNTLTHELLHAHVRSEIMVEFYPLQKNQDGHLNLNQDVYQKYRSIFNSENLYIYSIKEFIQISFMLSAGMIKPNGKSLYTKQRINKRYSDQELFQSLKKWYKEIEETIVHVLDFNYFYKSDSSFYLKAIWTSWLSLPFSKNYLDDYILRSICAITSAYDTADRLNRFDFAVELLVENLLEIKNIDFINDRYVDIVLNRLKSKKNIDQLRFYYINAFVHLVDITKKYFYSAGLKTLLNHDDDLTEAITEGEYTYDLSIGEFNNRKINSPITLINEVNKINISNITELNGVGKERIEKNSVWLNTLIVTSQKK